MATTFMNQVIWYFSTMKKATQALTHYLFTLILDMTMISWVIWLYLAHRRPELYISLALQL